MKKFLICDIFILREKQLHQPSETDAIGMITRKFFP
nr:MAG TPA: hypothetical protein [Caudoviricetes sp.]